MSVCCAGAASLDRMRSRSRSRSASSGFSSKSRSRSLAPALPTSVNRIVVARLTKNVTKEHLQEIFSAYGTITSILMVMNASGTAHIGKAEIEYETVEQAEAALKHMDRGQLDGNLLHVDFWKKELARQNVRRLPPSPSPYYRGGYQGQGGGFRGSYRSPPRYPPYCGRSPPRYRPRYQSPARGRSPSRSPPPRRPSYGRPISRTPPRYHSRSISRTPPRRRSPSRSRTPPRRSYRSPSYSRSPSRYRRSRSRTPPRRY